MHIWVTDQSLVYVPFPHPLPPVCLDVSPTRLLSRVNKDCDQNFCTKTEGGRRQDVRTVKREDGRNKRGKNSQTRFM